MNLKPMGRKIIIRSDSPKQKSEGGIYLPDNAQKRHGDILGALVLAVGPGQWQDGKLCPVGVKPGQRIIYLRMGGYEVDCEGEKVRVIDETDVLVIVGEGKE